MKIKANALSIKDENGTYHGVDMVIPDMKPLVDEIERTNENVTELKDDISQLSESIVEISDKVDGLSTTVKPENIFDKDTMAVFKNWYYASNPIGKKITMSSANAYSAIKIPVDGCSSITLKQGDSTATTSNIFAWYAVDKEMICLASATIGTGTSIKNGFTISEIPEGTKYILVSLSSYETAVSNNGFLSVVEGSVAKDYTPYFEPYSIINIDANSVSTDALQNGCVTPEKTSFMKLMRSENLFNVDTMLYEDKWYTAFTVGGKATMQDLALQYHNTYIAFEVPMYKQENVVICTSGGMAKVWKCAVLDANDIVLYKIDTETLTKDGIFITNIPSNATKIVGTIQNWYDELIVKENHLMVSYGSEKKDFTPYFEPYYDVPNKNADMALELARSKRSVMYIHKEDDDLRLFSKMKEAFDNGNMDVIFEKATYTLKDAYLYMWNTLNWHWENALPLGNGCRYYFNDSTIISNCPSNPPSNMNAERSILGTRVSGSDYEVHDVTLINNGGRYCIHDEGNNSIIPYCHKYENVTVIYNHTDLTPDTGAKAFGCGTGFDATLVFDGCVFKHNGQEITPLTIHAPTTNPNNDACKLHLIMKNSYFDHDNIFINVFEQGRDTVDFVLFGNKFGTVFDNPIVNLIENNNTIG